MNATQQKKRIVKELEEKPLGIILKAEKMPQRSTVVRWMREDVNFARGCIEAKRDRAELLLEEAQAELLSATDNFGSLIAHRKIQHLQWYLERLNPGLYGNRNKLEAPGGGIAALLADARKRQKTIEAVPAEVVETVQ